MNGASLSSRTLVLRSFLLESYYEVILKWTDLGEYEIKTYSFFFPVHLLSSLSLASFFIFKFFAWAVKSSIMR